MLTKGMLLVLLFSFAGAFSPTHLAETGTNAEKMILNKRSKLLAHSRRDFLAGGIAVSQFIASPTWAEDSSNSVISQLVSAQAPSRALENGLLESRVLSNVLNPPTYGMEDPDVYYPS